MDLYHIWCDLKPGVRDTTLVENARKYLGRLKSEGLIEGWRLTRRKLGLGVAGLGEFHIIIETNNLAQLEQAFQHVSSRAEPIEGAHHGLLAGAECRVRALSRLPRRASQIRRREVLRRA